MLEAYLRIKLLGATPVRIAALILTKFCYSKLEIIATFSLQPRVTKVAGLPNIQKYWDFWTYSIVRYSGK
jgi:hypothetical protein